MDPTQSKEINTFQRVKLVILIDITYTCTPNYEYVKIRSTTDFPSIIEILYFTL